MNKDQYPHYPMKEAERGPDPEPNPPIGDISAAESFIRVIAEQAEAEKIKQVMDKVEDEAINGDAIARERERHWIGASPPPNRHQRRKRGALERKKR